ncbi:hypothetical protein ACQ856_22375 [Mycolicibacterium psychrotolerans]|uniref:TetR/AcrR family transcriptional regulator n=1 Tax=Mycolicibacterium psychrotolerans TaxID=216929 RepID=UPI003D66B077
MAGQDQLMDTAEVLIGERGLAVSLREIAAHAQHRNTSAVIYHFGGVDGLIVATLQRRMTVLEQRRQELLDELDTRSDVGPHEIVEAIVAPALEIPYEQGATHYARFVERIRDHPAIAKTTPTLEKWPAVVALTRRLTEFIPEESRRGQARRIRLMSTAMFALMADYERRGELDSTRKRKRACEELTSILVGLLTAPVRQPISAKEI